VLLRAPHAPGPQSLPHALNRRQEPLAAEEDENRAAMPGRSTSFDDLLDEPRGGPVMTTAADDELRDMVALMPGRNPERMFSDAGGRKRAGGAAKSASAPTTVNRDGDRRGADSGSYYYYYSSEGGAATRLDFDEPAEDGLGSAVVESGGFSLAGSAGLARGNIADAVAGVASRFWTDDVRKIAAILQRRLRQLLPALRRFVAHVAAFWGGVTYLRRALTAFARVLNKDARVRELLRRVGWGSAETLRLALSLAAAVVSNAVRAYELMRDVVVPEARVLLPRAYSRAAFAALRAARRSPWALALGPASITLALHAARLPDPLWLHRKFGVAVGAGDGDRGGRTGGRTGGGGNAETSLSYTYTYATGTTRAEEPEPEPEPEQTLAETGEYYYTNGSGTYGGGDRGLSSVGGAGGMPFGRINAQQDGRGNVPARAKSAERRRSRGRVDKENDGLEYGDYGDAEYEL
jgi:hypothetical protein